MPYNDKSKQREYQRRYVAERRAEFFAGKRCANCGSDVQLELDHIDPTAKEAHSIWSWSQERRNAELAKCQVLCRICHRKKTRAQSYRADHGSASMYGRHRCRCAVCRRGHADARAAWRRRTGRH